MICQRPHQEYQADERWPSCLGGGCHETLDRQHNTHVFLCQSRANKISKSFSKNSVVLTHEAKRMRQMPMLLEIAKFALQSY